MILINRMDRFHLALHGEKVILVNTVINQCTVECESAMAFLETIHSSRRTDPQCVLCL
jgi:hypothetical protein